MKKETLEIITTKPDWDSALETVSNYDFYHTFEYHQIGLGKHQKPTLFKYSEGDITIALPLIIQKIENTNYFDATSVYGYAGPISNSLSANFDNTNFTKALKKYFQNNNIIAAFSRLNPYIKYQKALLKNFGELSQQGSVVNIDITLDLDIQRQKYQNRLKTHINKSRRNCTIKKAESKEEIQEFINIYYENMQRVNASKFYFFDEDYFFKLYSSHNFKTEILIATDQETGKTIAGSMFVTTNTIVQYHLSGCKTEYLHMMPIKLLIDEMRLIATERKMKYYNLGGGLGSNIEDSLFRFKSSFSKDFRGFYLWKLIVNKEVYEDLVSTRNMNGDISYFPKYRFSEIIK